MKINYVQAPLPFQGQKRRFLKPFKDALKDFSPTAIYIDLFGGSGLLSHTVKQYYPKAKVIYNDFDNFSERIKNIDKTNLLLNEIRAICAKSPQRKCRLSEELRAEIITRLEAEQDFVDWITLSSNLLFSMNYATNLEDLKKETFYNKVRLNDYKVDGYLEGVEIVRKDYRVLYEDYQSQKDIVLLVEPPYLSTDCSTYSGLDYWKLSDYLNVLKVLEDRSYFYFTSNKSQIVELCNWMESNAYACNPFADSTTVKVNTSLTYNASYEDIMIYRNNE